MKVVCINNENRNELTVGKTYEIFDRDEMISVIDDYGIRRNYHYSRFITLEEWRDNKLSMLEI